MPYQDLPIVSEHDVSTLMQRLLKEKRSARAFQERKHEDWNDNYELYRNKVKTNRLTQRQTVNIPLMKETIKTLLSKIDDAPIIDWKEKDGNVDKEIILQEIWNDDFDRLNLEGLDIQDKKNTLLYGRGTKLLNIDKKGLDIRAMDAFDVVYDPIMDPLDVETARFVVLQNIYRSLREILADPRYSKEGKDALRIWALSREGIVQSEKNKEALEKKNERLRSMGVQSDQFALFAGGDVIVNLTQHLTTSWDEKEKKWERRGVTYADDQHELLNKPLMELIGVDFWPLVTWGEDIETNDVWSDGPADLVRVPNQILNIWFSQLVENRTLKNFQMYWYDATLQGFKPQSYTPAPGRMIPAPGDPNKTVMPFNIGGLDDTLTAIDFVIKMVERGSAATAIEKGVSEKKQITLGEVEMLVGKALERTVAMAKFYRRSWFDLAVKWERLMHANTFGPRTLHKISRSGKMWPKTVYSNDWKSEKGFKPLVRSSSEQEEEQTKGIQKFMFIKSQFPGNIALDRISQKRMLEIVDLTPEEIREVEEEQKKLQQGQQQQQIPQLGGAQVTQPQIRQPEVRQPEVTQPQVKETDEEEEQLLGELDKKLTKVGR
jgi:hypothetical protein